MRFLKERYIRWVGISIVAVIVTQLDDGHMAGRSLSFQYLVSWIFTAVYWNGAFLIFMMFRKIFPEIKKTTTRLIWTYVTLVFWMSVGGIPVKLILGFMQWEDVLSLHVYMDFLAMNLVIALIVGTLYETTFFFEKWKEAIRQNEELKNQQIRTQFEVLQNQMSPHFLFNSLNTLATLISENQHQAMEFTQKLSDVYRYILQNKERELVELREEMQFAEAYVYLLKIRFPDNLKVDFRVDSLFLGLYIAPLTLQMLIENCIKHNVVSKANPLTVEVYISDNSIIVRNNLKLKPILDKSTKTGLENIKKRYEYFGERKIEIVETAHSFIVGVPLITVGKEPDMI